MGSETMTRRPFYPSFITPLELDDDELEELIDATRQDMRRKYRRASKYYGHPCPEGQRRYHAYLEARAYLGELCAERENR